MIKPRTFDAVVAIAIASLAGEHSSARAQAQQEDPCLPVSSNSYWTLEDIQRNQAAIDRIKNAPGKIAKVDPPVAVQYLPKYLDCKRWIRDSETYITRELLANYEVMQGIPRLFYAGVGLVLGRVDLDRLGPMGSLVERKVTGGLHDIFFGDLEKTGVVPMIESMFVQLQKQHPDDSLETILGRISGELKSAGSGFSGLKPETIRFFEATARDLGMRQVLGTWKPFKRTDQEVATAKARLRQVDKMIAAKTEAVDGVKRQSAAIGGAIKKVSSPTSSAPSNTRDWTRLSGLYRQLVASSGRDQAERTLNNAASDPKLQQALGISSDDAKALADDITAKAQLRVAAESARNVTDRSKELAQLANNLGWSEGASQFSNLASAASSFEQIATSLASAAGPPGPWQMVGAANGAFALAGALSNAFGGGGQKKDDGLAKALGQIMEGLRSINRQIADMRQEQRDHFAYAERYLELLVSMSAAEALSGISACQRTLLGYETWTETTDTRDVLVALTRPNSASDLRLRASQCKDWLWDDRFIPVGPGGVNPVYKQLLTVANDIASRNDTIMAGFKNRGFLRTESYFPQLHSLVTTDDAPGLLSDRRSWLDQPTKSIDINERLVQTGHSIAGDWTVERLSDQLLSTSTVVTAAEAALLLQPASAALGSDGALRRLSDADTDAAHGMHSSVLRDLYGLALVALAQENLIAGGPVARLVDQLLDQSDVRDAELKIQKCVDESSAARISCASSMGVPLVAIGEECGMEPKPKAQTLCAKLGIRKFDEQVKAARLAIANFPTLRQNVLIARMWRLSSRETAKQRWAPNYEHALLERVETLDSSNDPGAFALRQIFNDMPVVQLGSTKAAGGLGDQYITEGIYFSRLSGSCDGIGERILIGSAVCKLGRCDAFIGRDVEGEQRILDVDTKKRHEAKPDDPELCIMGALPSAQEFGQGRILETVALQRIRDVVERLAMTITFDRVYATTDPAKHSDRWAIVDSLRPPTSILQSGRQQK